LNAQGFIRGSITHPCNTFNTSSRPPTDDQSGKLSSSFFGDLLLALESLLEDEDDRTTSGRFLGRPRFWGGET
jgi:hypothetical protein